MKKLIIAPSTMHKDIVSHLRANDPFCTFKIIDKNELCSAVLGDIKHEAIPILMHQYNLKFDIAIEVIKYLPYIDLKINYNDEKIKELQGFKAFLAKNSLISYNSFFKNIVKDCTTEIIGYSRFDNELRYLLELLDLPCSFSNNNEFLGTSVFQFTNIEEEVLFILNRCADLINNGENPNNIYLFILDKQYLEFIEKFKKSFGLVVNQKCTNNLYSQRVASLLLNNIDFSNKEASFSGLDKHDPVLVDELSSLFDLVNSFDLDKNEKLDYFVSILKKSTMPSKTYKKAIQCIYEPCYAEGKKIFVLGFKQNQFPKSIKDMGLLNDKQTTLLHMNSSEDMTNISRDVFLDFFSTNNNFVYSYSIKDKENDDIYLSPLASSNKVTKIIGFVPDKIYSEFYLYYCLGKYSDLRFKYLLTTSEYIGLSKLKTIPYATYSWKYTKIDEDFTNTTFTYSPTSTTNYFKCPFKYYLDKIIGFDLDEKIFAADIGTIFHKCLENYDKSDDEILKIFEDQMNIQEITLASEKQLLLNLQESALEVCHAHKSLIDGLGSFEELREHPITYYINEKVKIFGYVDNVITFGDYYTIIDYKTGNDEFKPKNMDKGFSLQLPIYYLCLSNTIKMDKQLFGLYIQHVIDTEKTYKYNFNSKIKDYLELDGETLNDSNAFDKFEPGLGTNRQSIFIQAISRKDDGLDGYTVTKEVLDGYKDKAVEKILEADANIRNLEFSIAPQKDRFAPCDFCPYQDICKYKPIESNEEDDE